MQFGYNVTDYRYNLTNLLNNKSVNYMYTVSQQLKATKVL